MAQIHTLNTREQKAVQIILQSRNAALQSSDIHTQIIAQGEDISFVTTKRLLSELESEGILSVTGDGRSTAYIVTDYGRIIFPIDARAYCAVEPDRRYGSLKYNFGLFDLAKFDPFTDDEHSALNAATKEYEKRVRGLSPASQEKELERFIIELSWKSSRIEGNTYTLLDTEKLIVRGIEAPGHDKNEATMILNHKDAFKFIRENAAAFKTMTRSNMEEVHKLLVKDLNVNFGLRSKPVGVTGSTYKPLDNGHQISEAVEALCAAIGRMQTAHGKALLAILGISYIQPFEDGNKRTARLMANAILLAHGHAPLSYRSVDENDYREAMLVFYELNSLMPFKNIFIEQYRFAAENYLIANRT